MIGKRSRRAEDDDDDEADHDESHHPYLAKRARLFDMRSAPRSPTDRANLEIFQKAQLNLAKVDEQLIQHQWLQQFMDEVRSDGESSMGDEDIARLADWDGQDWETRDSGDNGNEIQDEQPDTPATQYDDRDEKGVTFLEDAVEDVLAEHGVNADEKRCGLSSHRLAHGERNMCNSVLHDKTVAGTQEQQEIPTRGRGHAWSLALLKDMAHLYR